MFRPVLENGHHKEGWTLSSSVTLTTALLSSLADRIVEARRLHGADSPYVIGLINGVNWLLESEGVSGEFRRQFASLILDNKVGASSGAASGLEQETTNGSSALAENSWARGSVKWFNNDKGYGFISTESDTDVFVHWRDISSWDRSLVQGDEVEFMVTKTAKGFQAVNVMKSETAEGQPADEARTVQGGEELGSGDGDSDAPESADVSGSPAEVSDSIGTDGDPAPGATRPVPEFDGIEEGGETSQEAAGGTAGSDENSSDNDTRSDDDGEDDGAMVERYNAPSLEKNEGGITQQTSTAEDPYVAEGDAA